MPSASDAVTAWIAHWQICKPCKTFVRQTTITGLNTKPKYPRCIVGKKLFHTYWYEGRPRK